MYGKVHVFWAHVQLLQEMEARSPLLIGTRRTRPSGAACECDRQRAVDSPCRLRAMHVVSIGDPSPMPPTSNIPLASTASNKPTETLLGC
jgi:hypothetical protein